MAISQFVYDSPSQITEHPVVLRKRVQGTLGELIILSSSRLEFPEDRFSTLILCSAGQPKSKEPTARIGGSNPVIGTPVIHQHLKYHRNYLASTPTILGQLSLPYLLPRTHLYPEILPLSAFLSGVHKHTSSKYIDQGLVAHHLEHPKLHSIMFNH